MASDVIDSFSDRGDLDDLHTLQRTHVGIALGPSKEGWRFASPNQITAHRNAAVIGLPGKVGIVQHIVRIPITREEANLHAWPCCGKRLLAPERIKDRLTCVLLRPHASQARCCPPGKPFPGIVDHLIVWLLIPILFAEERDGSSRHRCAVNDSDL